MPARRGKTLEEFAAEHPLQKGPKCGVFISPNHEAIENGLKKNIAATIISKWLKNEKGELLPAYTIAKHKRGDCRCQS